MKIKDYVKTAEDRRTITLVHQKHGYAVNIAKNTLSEKMRGDFAAMPLNLACGGEVSMAEGGEVNNNISPDNTYNHYIPQKGIVGGTVYDGSDDEKFLFGDYSFDINKAREISQKQANAAVPVDKRWIDKTKVDPKEAMKSESKNPVFIAQIHTPNGLKPLLIDGNHRMYKAIQDRRANIPAFIFSPEQTSSLFVKKPEGVVHPKHEDDEQAFAKGGMVKGYAGDTDNPQDQVVSPDNQMMSVDPSLQAQLPTNQPVAPNPMPTNIPATPALTPEQQKYDDFANQFNLMVKAGVISPDKAKGTFAESGGKAPTDYDDNMGAQAVAAVKADQQNQQDAIKDQQEQAASKNAIRSQLGVEPISAPITPNGIAQGPTPPLANVPPPSGQNYDLQGQGQMANYNPMMAGYNEMANAYTGAMKNMQQGIMGEAQTLGEQGRQNALAAAANNQAIADINYQHQQNMWNIQQDMGNVLEDIKNHQINPNHYMENMSTPGKVATAIGLALGGFGASVNHTQNYAMEFLNNQINRDVDAQKANLGKKETLYSAYLKQYGNERDANDMALLTQHAIYANKLQEIAGQTESPLAKARAQQALAQQQIQMAPVMQQMAMRRTIMQNMNQMSPEMAIRFLAPEKEQEGLNKDLQNLQNTARARDNIMSASDQMSQIIQGTNWKNPAQANQSIQKLHALKDPMIAGLSKETAGRYTESDAGALGASMPYFPDSVTDLRGMAKMITGQGDDPRTLAIKRAQLDKTTAEKMNFPSLKPYGIDPFKISRYGRVNAPRTFTAGAPKPPGPNG